MPRRESQHGTAHRRAFLMPGSRLAVQDQRIRRAGGGIGCGELREGRLEGVGRREVVQVADADELRARRDQPGDLAIACKVQQSGDGEVDAVTIVRSPIR